MLHCKQSPLLRHSRPALRSIPSARTESIMHGDRKTVKRPTMSFPFIRTRCRQPLDTNLSLWLNTSDAGANPHPGNPRSRFRADSLSLVLLTPHTLSYV